jgi:protoporphyrinogen oxidase
MQKKESNDSLPKAIIIGAGPAGLTAALELLTRTNIIPIVLEQSNETGGLSRTVNYKGNRLDIGGHRFFSKSDRVMKWWLQMMPLEAETPVDIILQYQNNQTILKRTNKENAAYSNMMVRPRRSRIYFLKKFFPYPLSLSGSTLAKLGAVRTSRILFSYIWARIFPPKKVETLEEFFISRFGQELYRTFFKSYTEKVWGVPCSSIPAEWGAQRIKDLSIRQAVRHMVLQIKNKGQKLPREKLSTSLIEQFLYPRLGPGQFWEQVAQEIVAKGGTIIYGCAVQEITYHNNRITNVIASCKDGGRNTYRGDYFFSTMPIRDFIAGLGPLSPSSDILQVAKGLQYRDFITIGLLVSRFSEAALKQGPITDNWIYIQDAGVQIGRLQIFNNWSPFMVAQPGTWWIGLEYFCNCNDELWKMNDEDIVTLGIKELVSIGLIDNDAKLDATVIRQEKTYPAYTGTYQQFQVLKSYLLQFENLYPIGRNGMHRYNNSDHSMLTAMLSVDHILGEILDKNLIWEINTEESYHEEKSER